MNVHILMLNSLSLLLHSLRSLPREQCHSQWAALPSSIKLTKTIPHRPSPRPVSQVTVYFVKLIIDTNHHIGIEVLASLFGDGLFLFVTDNMFALYNFTLFGSCCNNMAFFYSVSTHYFHFTF